MAFDEFLIQLEQALEETANTSSPAGGTGTPAPTTPRSLLRMTFDPTRKQADQPHQILIGVGDWLLNDSPVEHRGICLNHKGTAYRFGKTYQYASVTDFVLAPPEAVSQHWQDLTGGLHDPRELLRRFELIVEDVGPDSCFALLCWLALRSGVEADEIRHGPGEPWVNAIRAWETTGMADEAFTSWAVLLSALGHSYIPPANAWQTHEADFNAIDLSQAWREALRFTVTLLRQKVNPNVVPSLWHLSGYARAMAFLRSEYQDYLASLFQAICLQLLVPLRETGDARQLLVDAYFAVETWPSGSKKLFIRTDREHTYLQQGFALMGLYRPDGRTQGTGNDMTVSVNPQTGIYLKALWEELERLENERWQGQRPRENARPIVSYHETEGYTEPWWDDHGRYTLLGAPRRLPDGRLGTRLAWSDVVEAAWRCYNPLRGLCVRDALDHDRECPLEQCRRQRQHFEDRPLTLERYLVAAKWLLKTAIPQAVVLSPTAKRFFAALVTHERTTAPVSVTDLPEEQEFDFASLRGGFAVIHEQGVFLFDDWRVAPLKLPELKEEFHRAFGMLSEVHWVDSRLNGLVHERAVAFPRTSSRPPPAVLADLATLRARLAETKQRYGLKSEHEDIRRFRQRLESRWGIDHVADGLHRRVAELEDAFRTTSTLQTQGLIRILSTYALPFLISSATTNFLSPWIGARAAAVGCSSWTPLLQVVIYVVLAGVLILALMGLHRGLAWSINRQRQVSAVHKSPDGASQDESSTRNRKRSV